MKLTCPSCGVTYWVKQGGKPGSKLTAQDVLEKLKGSKSISEAARKLGCSRAFIYKRLKFLGIEPAVVIGRKELKVNL